MKIDIDENGTIRLCEVFSGILLETEEGNQISVCMRDDTLEINVMPKGENTKNWWRVNMQNGTIANMSPAKPECNCECETPDCLIPDPRKIDPEELRKPTWIYDRD